MTPAAARKWKQVATPQCIPNKLYWKLRFSMFGRVYYTIKTFLYIQWNARKIAVALDDTLRAMGGMNHPDGIKTSCKKCKTDVHAENPNNGSMCMTIQKRAELISKGTVEALPFGWRWRKD